MSRITREEFMMGRDGEYPTSEELEINAAVTLFRVNKLLEQFCAETRLPRPPISSGYRPGRFNVAAKGAPNSAHLTCQAVDISDAKGRLNMWISDKILETYNLYREDPSVTPTWCHLQSRPTKSGNRTFKP